MGIAGGGTTQQSKMTQSMVDVMSLPMMAAGGTILSATTKYMQSLGGEGANINPEIQRVARPIAETFGLPPSIVNKAKQGSAGKSPGIGKPGEEGGEPSKNIFAKLMDGFGAMLDKMKESINTTPPPGPGSDGPGGEGQTVEGKVGEIISANAKATYYDPSLGGINASGAKTPEGLPATSTGEGFVSSKFTAAAFPELIKNLPENMTTPHSTFRGGRTLSSGQAFNVMVTDRTGKSAIVRVNDVGPGVEGHDANHMLDFSPGVADYFGANRSGGLKITMAPKNATPGPITPEQAQQIAQPTPPPKASPTAQLGQAITNNYGLPVGQERPFTVPGYGEVKARKTTTGFDFYGPGMNNKLDVSPSNPQGKTIVDYFKSTNGGQTINPPDRTISPPEKKEVGSLLPGNNSESGNIAVLNIGGGGGGSPTSNSGSVSQPSGEDGTERGIHPLGPFGFNSISIGVG